MAKRKVDEEPNLLYRAVRFEVRMTDEEFQTVYAISKNLQEVWNSGLKQRQEVFFEFIAPLYEEMKTAEESEKPAIKARLKLAYREHSVTLFDQINALTPKREDPRFAEVTRNFQEETLDALDGAYKSFLSLRRKGDFDAKAPRERQVGFFQKIPGRLGFKVIGSEIVISLGGGRKVTFVIPEYQLGKLAEGKAKKFEFYRDEPNLAKPGRFWISIVYEIPKPVQSSFEKARAAYLALGASSVGVVSPAGEEVLSLWRSDKHWQPKIASVEERMKHRVKGSRGWQKLRQVRRRMQVISARQKLQDEREVASYLVKRHGYHFVVTKYVVRSKEGKLADCEKPERGGLLGLNWAAQNTGSLSRLTLLLENKVREKGGSLRRHELVLQEAPPELGSLNKIWMAKKLREAFLAL